MDEVPESATGIGGISIRLVNALYRGAGGATQGATVQWEFSYEDD